MSKARSDPIFYLSESWINTTSGVVDYEPSPTQLKILTSSLT